MIIGPPPRLTNSATLLKYVQVDLWNWLKEVTAGITKLSFGDNFQSFLVENVSIPAGQEVGIQNQFKIRNISAIPIGRLIVRQQGDATIIDGTTPWNINTVYLKNPSANDAVVSVIFFR